MLLKTDNLGLPHFNNHDLVKMIYSGNADKIHIVLCDPSDELDKFNSAMQEQGFPELQTYIPLDVDQKTFDGVCQSEWFMPDKFKEFDLIGFIHVAVSQETGIPISDIKNLCASAEYLRAQEELKAFQDRDLIQLLRYMVYLVHFMRENKIVWGVGRGSSVSSYLLYLIGVHRINPIRYNLDWREFLR